MDPKINQLAYHYLSARDIENADIAYHAAHIIESGDLYYNYKFARDIEGADIKAHKQVIDNSGDEFYMELIKELIEMPKKEKAYTLKK